MAHLVENHIVHEIKAVLIWEFIRAEFIGRVSFLGVHTSFWQCNMSVLIAMVFATATQQARGPASVRRAPKKGASDNQDSSRQDNAANKML